MSVELNSIKNIVAGVKSSTGKGPAGLTKIAKATKNAVKRKADNKARAEKEAAKAAKRKENEDKKTSSKPSSSNKPSTPTSNKTKVNAPKGKTPGVGDVREALGSKKISIEEAIKLNPKGTSTPISKKPSNTFTPKSKGKKATQPSLPGMTKSKVNQA